MSYLEKFLAPCALLVVLSISTYCPWLVAADAVPLPTSFTAIEGIRGIVAQKTASYAIDDLVPIAPPYYVFTITSAHDESYQVQGITGLLKATHEITVLELYRATPQGNQIWGGAKESVANIGKGGKQIVLHPGDSTVAIGRSVARAGRMVSRMVTGIFKKKQTSSSGTDLEKTPGGAMAAEQARRAAYELQLDVYSGNPYVQAMLGEIAKQRMAGSLGVSAAAMAASLIVPGGGALATISNGALTPGAHVEATELAIRNNPPEELYMALSKQFMAGLGLGEDALETQSFLTLLDNPNYTPRQKAYLTLYIEQMAQVHGRLDMLKTLAGAITVKDAETMYQQMQLLSASHRFGRRYASFVCRAQRIAGQLARGDIIMILPYDFADDSWQMREEVRNIPPSDVSRNIWLLGNHTVAFEKMAKDNGIASVHDNILHYDAFSRTVTQHK